MRSISTKLILAFLSIGIVSVAIIFITARWNTRLEFINFLSDQTQTNLISTLSDYYLQHGSWQGVEVIIRPASQQPGMDMGPGHGPQAMHPFTLTDQSGTVIFSTDRKYKQGTKITNDVLELGIPISNNEQVVGILIATRMPFEGNQRELEFIERTNLTLLYGALIGAVIALLLGIFLSRTLTRPIRELTQATHAVSEGDLSQQVPIRSNDELGELAQAFHT